VLDDICMLCYENQCRICDHEREVSEEPTDSGEKVWHPKSLECHQEGNLIAFNF
jgi:hypothetical protein